MTRANGDRPLPAVQRGARPLDYERPEPADPSVALDARSARRLACGRFAFVLGLAAAGSMLAFLVVSFPSDLHNLKAQMIATAFVAIGGFVLAVYGVSGRGPAPPRATLALWLNAIVLVGCVVVTVAIPFL